MHQAETISEVDVDVVDCDCEFVVDVTPVVLDDVCAPLAVVPLLDDTVVDVTPVVLDDVDVDVDVLVDVDVEVDSAKFGWQVYCLHPIHGDVAATQVVFAGH